MKTINPFFLFCIVLLFTACSDLNFDGELKKGRHIYVQNSTCYMIPPVDFKETRDYNGFQHESFKWSISAEKSEKSLDDFENIFSKINLKALNRKFVDKQNINYKSQYTGQYYKYMTPNKSIYNYSIIFDLSSYRLHIKSWIHENHIDVFESQILESFQSLVLADPGSITDEMENPYTVNNSFVKFAFKKGDEYVYHKKEMTGDSFQLFIWDRIETPMTYPEDHLKYRLGKDYTEIERVVTDSSWITKSLYWTGQSSDKSKMAIVGINDFGFGKRANYAFTYNSNFDSNYETAQSIIKNIEWYK